MQLFNTTFLQKNDYIVDAETVAKPDVSFDSCYSCQSRHRHARKVSRPS